MSFFNLSDGNNAAATDGTFETSGGNMEPIPANTQLLAVVDEAKWDEYQGDDYISLRWTIMAPEEHKNRKIFQKVRVNDPKKGDNAKRMLAAIDKNAGGKLAASGAMPTDESLTMALCHKPMVIRVQVWNMTKEDTGEKMSGNWIDKVAARNGGHQQSAPAPQQEAVSASAPASAPGGDIPF